MRTLNTAKEAWDHLTSLFIGNESIQESKFEEIHNEADNFCMYDSETPEDMYRRLKALSVAMYDHRAHYVDDKWIKRKFVQAVLPFEDQKMTSIKGRADYRKMSSNDILSEIVAMTISKKNAEDALARGQGVRKGNLALKAKVVVEEEGRDDDDDEIEWGP